jgi:hypothetical protein
MDHGLDVDLDVTDQGTVDLDGDTLGEHLAGIALEVFRHHLLDGIVGPPLVSATFVDVIFFAVPP